MWLVERVAEEGITFHEIMRCEVRDYCPALKSSKKTRKNSKERAGNNWIVGASKKVTFSNPGSNLPLVSGPRLSPKGVPRVIEKSV